MALASAPLSASPIRGARCPSSLVTAIRQAVRERDDWPQTAQQVAAELRRHLPGPRILTRRERAGDPAGYRSHLLHAETDGSFSIVAMVWLPGQVTPVHDHVTWCVTGVLQGAEYEEIFALRHGDTTLAEVARKTNTTGDVSGFAPPGDIHRVRNQGDGMAISMHVYGADISRLGSSVRRIYDLPVVSGRPARPA
jgi:predicted metal-dependent enzyme (double-stranded beta helix superfamily)